MEMLFGSFMFVVGMGVGVLLMGYWVDWQLSHDHLDKVMRFFSIKSK